LLYITYVTKQMIRITKRLIQVRWFPVLPHVNCIQPHVSVKLKLHFIDYINYKIDISRYCHCLFVLEHCTSCNSYCRFQYWQYCCDPPNSIALKLK
jgi:hypothetical protein